MIIIQILVYKLILRYFRAQFHVACFGDLVTCKFIFFSFNFDYLAASLWFLKMALACSASSLNLARAFAETFASSAENLDFLAAILASSA